MARSILSLTLFIASCASGSPAPITYGSPHRDTAATSQTARIDSFPTGDNDSALSAYALRPEEVQPFDPPRLPRTHRVRPGESIYDIATAYQVPLPALIEHNRLEPPYALSPGRVVELPPPRIHIVRPGEDLRDVAVAYEIDPRSLALLNRMTPPYVVRPGDRLVLPATARAADATTAATPPEDHVQGAPGRLGWPLRGAIVIAFGAQADGARSDGIEIAGDEGETIVAAADGEVVYAGADLPAYGVLVLVRHADDMVTAYGYARRALVSQHQRVRAGEAIAELGPGQGGPARLLFQVRRGGEAIDPALFLPTEAD